MLIYLDLDGVIINWVKGVCEWFEIPYEPEKVTHWNAMTELTNTTNNEFWNDLKFSAFWENLEFYPEAISFIKQLEKIDKVILLSSPAIGCAGYRQNWIEKNLPEFFKRGNYAITPSKWICANNDSILIDDYEKNCIDFIFCDGHAIIYSQPWNALYKKGMSEKDKNNFIIEYLIKFKKES